MKKKLFYCPGYSKICTRILLNDLLKKEIFSILRRAAARSFRNMHPPCPHGGRLVVAASLESHFQCAVMI